MGSKATGVTVEVGDHCCSTPVLVGDITNAVGETDGTMLRWVCNECGSTWVGAREWRKSWPGTRGEYAFGIAWKRVWGSSRRWRKREQARVRQTLS